MTASGIMDILLLVVGNKKRTVVVHSLMESPESQPWFPTAGWSPRWVTDIEVAWPIRDLASAPTIGNTAARARIAFSKPPDDAAGWRFRIVPVYATPAGASDVSHVDLRVDELYAHIIATSPRTAASPANGAALPVERVLRRLSLDLARAERVAARDGGALTLVSESDAKAAAEELAAYARAVALAPPPLPAVPAAVAASTEEASPAAGATAAAPNQIPVAESAGERQTKKARKSSEAASTASAAARPAAAPRVLPFTPRSSLPRACADEALAKICALNTLTTKSSSPASVTAAAEEVRDAVEPSTASKKRTSKGADDASRASVAAAGRRERAPRSCSKVVA